MSKYKSDLEQFIREEYDSPERKVYKNVMDTLEKMADVHNKSDDLLRDLIPKVAKLMRKHETSELPIADMLTVMGMKLKDFQKYKQIQRESEVLDKFVDKVHKAKRQDWFNEFEKKWVDAEEKQKSKQKSPKSPKPKPKPKSKSPSAKKASARKSPKSPGVFGPSKPSDSLVHMLQVKRKPKPGQAAIPAALASKVISRESVPANEILRALDVSGRVPMKANVLKSRESVPATEILLALDVSGRVPMKANVLKSRSGRRQSPRPRKSPKSPKSPKPASRRKKNTKSESARRRCNPGSVYHSPSRRCRKEKKMTCKQLRDWYETHHK
jgi:hypothetical protein